MSLHVLVIPDKFKGTLTAQAAAKAIASGWKSSRPKDHLELLPMSDGGDGFGEVLSAQLGGKRQTIRTVDAAHRPCKAHWWWDAKTKTAVIESAKIIGLAQLPRGQYHPFELDTYGLGAVLQAAAAKGARRCFVGIGGSATNDGGFGMARALGWKFLDSGNNEIERWTELDHLVRVVPPKTKRLFAELIVAIDVQNPLLGKFGCSRIYGPQKGLRPEDFPLADKTLGKLAKVTNSTVKEDFAKRPGAGAAGGLGFGLQRFLGAKPKPGVDLFARHAQLTQRLHRADLVLTAEGAIDKSTLMGKGVGEIAVLCQKRKIPCIGFAGYVGDVAQVGKRFTQAHGLTPDFTSKENAMSQPERWLTALAKQVAATWP